MGWVQPSRSCMRWRLRKPQARTSTRPHSPLHASLLVRKFPPATVCCVPLGHQKTVGEANLSPHMQIQGCKDTPGHGSGFEVVSQVVSCKCLEWHGCIWHKLLNGGCSLLDLWFSPCSFNVLWCSWRVPSRLICRSDC